MPFHLGEQRKTVDEDILEIKGTDQSLDSEYGFPPSLKFDTNGIYLWKIPLVFQEKFKPDEKTLRNLKSLGYIK
jgi:hypothetical protein